MGERILSTFIDLVKINSTSRNEAEIRKYLVDLFKSMKLKPRIDKKGNLHLLIQGALVNGPVILFNAHMDTVVPGNNIKPIILKDRITSDGTTILGADDKAGLAGVIELLRELKNQKTLFKEIKVILTVEEEIGLQGAKALTFEDVAADYCFVLDSDGDVGSVVIKAPAQELINIKIKGKAAHAGLNPEDGISAIKIAGDAIAKLKVGRIDKETTVNIGQIKGGIATNIIPEEVTIRAEARSHDEDKLQLQVRKLINIFQAAAEKHGGSIEYEIKRSYDRVAMSKDAGIVQIAKTAAQRIGLKTKISASGGGSDASFIYSFGIPTIALCIGMEKVHSRQEYIKIQNLKLLPKFLTELVSTAVAYHRGQG